MNIFGMSDIALYTHLFFGLWLLALVNSFAYAIKAGYTIGGALKNRDEWKPKATPLLRFVIVQVAYIAVWFCVAIFADAVVDQLDPTVISDEYFMYGIPAVGFIYVASVLMWRNLRDGASLLQWNSGLQTTVYKMSFWRGFGLAVISLLIAVLVITEPDPATVPEFPQLPFADPELVPYWLLLLGYGLMPAQALYLLVKAGYEAYFLRREQPKGWRRASWRYAITNTLVAVMWFVAAAVTVDVAYLVDSAFASRLWPAEVIAFTLVGLILYSVLWVMVRVVVYGRIFSNEYTYFRDNDGNLKRWHRRPRRREPIVAYSPNGDDEYGVES